MSESRFFTKGKIDELRSELILDRKSDPKYIRRKDAMKRVIANMSLGNDMAPLYSDVLSLIQVPIFELKKMVYLFLINYSRNNDDLAIMAVNSFNKDIYDPNPLVRAAALRTMGYIASEKVGYCLCDPIKRCLKDSDPFVRKTAVICIAKISHIDSGVFLEKEGFLSSLEELLLDPNPTVVANALAVFYDLFNQNSVTIKKNYMTSSLASKLLAILNDCSEWNQAFIIESLLLLEPATEKEAVAVVERVLSRLQHSNTGIVMGVIRLICHFMSIENFSNSSTGFNSKQISEYCKKISAPLVTLLNAIPEIQYVALQNIRIIIQKYPKVLSNEFKVFFVKYNDKRCVKFVKLEIMIRLVDESNADLFLSELKEYANELDVEFSRKAVRIIGLTAIKIETIADKCVKCLVDLIQAKVNYVVQESIVVIKDIFRKYPNEYENIIGTLCECLDDGLDEPEAKEALLWIIGHYAERIENAKELIEYFAEGFVDEPLNVQVVLLTATIKLFLKKPSESQDLVKVVLQNATNSSNPDLRDRGFIYWRLLSGDNPDVARSVVLSKKPILCNDSLNEIDDKIINELIFEIGTVSSVCHRPSHFIFGNRLRRPQQQDLTIVDSLKDTLPLKSRGQNYQNDVIFNHGVNLLDLGDDNNDTQQEASIIKTTSNEPPQSKHAYSSHLTELESIFNTNNHLTTYSSLSAPQSPNPPLMLNNNYTQQQNDYELIFDPKICKGLEIYGCISTDPLKNDLFYFCIRIRNLSMMNFNNFMISFDKNMFGVNVTSASEKNPLLFVSINAGVSAEFLIPLEFNNLNHQIAIENDEDESIKIALRNNVGIFYSAISACSFLGYFLKKANLSPTEYVQLWKTIPESNENKFNVSLASILPSNRSPLSLATPPPPSTLVIDQQQHSLNSFSEVFNNFLKNSLGLVVSAERVLQNSQTVTSSFP